MRQRTTNSRKQQPVRCKCAYSSSCSVAVSQQTVHYFWSYGVPGKTTRTEQNANEDTPEMARFKTTDPVQGKPKRIPKAPDRRHVPAPYPHLSHFSLRHLQQSPTGSHGAKVFVVHTRVGPIVAPNFVPDVGHYSSTGTANIASPLFTKVAPELRYRVQGRRPPVRVHPSHLCSHRGTVAVGGRAVGYVICFCRA